RASQARPSPSAGRSSSSAPAAPEEVALSSRTRDGRARLSRLPSLQGPSRSPWGEWWRMTGTGPEETAAWLPRRALVLGLARSGTAAALALARRGVSVVAADRSLDVEASRLSA